MSFYTPVLFLGELCALDGPISVEAESLLMPFFWVPILSSIKQTLLITCSINTFITDYLEKRPSELAITYKK